MKKLGKEIIEKKKEIEEKRRLLHNLY